MISYHQLKKIYKKKLGVSQNWAKLGQNLSKLAKSWYYAHYETKKYMKNIKKG